jgi:hypothetical protein
MEQENKVDHLKVYLTETGSGQQTAQFIDSMTMMMTLTFCFPAKLPSCFAFLCPMLHDFKLRMHSEVDT